MDWVVLTVKREEDEGEKGEGKAKKRKRKGKIGSKITWTGLTINKEKLTLTKIFLKMVTWMSHDTMANGMEG